MKPEHHLDLYSNTCKEIFYRCAKIDEFLFEGRRTSDFGQVELNYAALHTRLCCELIAFLGLIASKSAYSEAYKAFKKDWRLTEVLNRLHRLSGDALPVPVSRKFDEDDNVKSTSKRSVKQQLDRDYLIYMHGCSSFFLHTMNPFRANKDFPGMKTLLEFTEVIKDNLSEHELCSINGDVYIGYTDENGNFGTAFAKIISE